MFSIFRSIFAKDMAIDLGTANTIVYLDRQGIVLNEPSVVAIETVGAQKRVRSVGLGAKEMLGRTPGNIEAIRPLKDGVIADYRIAEQMLNHFIRKVHGSRFFTPGPRIVICVPISSTPVDRRTIRESALAAGATKVFLIEEPMAAALGCELPVQEASGCMVVDIGGGTAEIGVISLGGLIYGKSITAGGDRLDRAIIEHVRKTHGVAIGEATSERVKKDIAAAHPECFENDNREVQVSGQKIPEGVPRRFTISTRDVHEAIRPALMEIVQAVRTGLGHVPPELSADIAERGIALTGGGALINGMDRLIADETGVPVRVAEDPLTCVARGCGEALKFAEDGGDGSLFSG